MPTYKICGVTPQNTAIVTVATAVQMAIISPLHALRYTLQTVHCVQDLQEEAIHLRQQYSLHFSAMGKPC